MTPDRRKAARELLAFYQEAGIDALIGETTVDRLADEPLPSPEKATREARQEEIDATADRLRPSAAPLSGEGRLAAPPIAASPEVAGSSDAERRYFAEWCRKVLLVGLPVFIVGEALSPWLLPLLSGPSYSSAVPVFQCLMGFEGCALKITAKQLVFADGNPKSRVMFVGEAPGRDEDIEGLPFVGRSGKLLDRMMAAIGLERASVYIANVVPWRPPGNRTPTPQETAICLPFTLRQIELADPDILVCLGNPATQTLLSAKEGITRTRGRWFKYHTGSREIRAIPTFHPAFLLRQPLSKRLAWRDFLAIKNELAAIPQNIPVAER